MESRDDKLIAVIGLLSASLIGMIFLFIMTWLADVRRFSDDATTLQSCHKKTSPPPIRHH
ncbi:hypothetical protein [Duffyella gerundensis]|uniref:hypothetical protein n=1 Tax=Duffyella gerundensis TaxID=1619313 RepID=UPI0016540254|nr:hypothetical protein [Duffyella gerundensis]